MIDGLRNFVNFAEKGLDAVSISSKDFLAQIQILEQELNRKLVRRLNSTDIILTQFGQKFTPYAKRCIITINEGLVVASTQQSIYDFDNQLTIGLPQDSASTWALNCVKNFNKMHPGLRLVLFADNTLTDRIRENADIVFWSLNESLSNYEPSWYIEYKYALYASSEYMKLRGTPTLQNITQHDIIAYSGNDNNAKMSNWHLSGEYGLPLLRPTVLSQSRDLIVKMVSDGLGIGAVCRQQDVYYGYPNLKHVLKQISGPILKHYFLIRKDLNEPRRCNVMLLDELFKEYFSKNNVKMQQI
jgi:DNA-binding transcriptional LysR family regulator